MLYLGLLAVFTICGLIAWGAACVEGERSRRAQVRDGTNGINRYITHSDLRTYTIGFAMTGFAVMVVLVLIFVHELGARTFLFRLFITLTFACIPLLGIQVWVERQQIRNRIKWMHP